MGCKSYLLSTSFGCRLFITFCCCFQELTNRSEGKKETINALDGAVLVGTVKPAT